eukprot:GHVR01188640.1.p1 GENE.GHVR01188640.1~~GHVR01188640.1.p1  ORF type:complete len:106 (-),score=22.26 GHVR01188640.1:234-551(-)
MPLKRVKSEDREQREEGEDDSTSKKQKKVVPETSGSFNGKDYEMWLNEKEDIKLSVTKFKGKVSVDIRHYWDGKPTKKGAHMAVDVFRKLVAWDGLDAALVQVDV